MRSKMGLLITRYVVVVRYILRGGFEKLQAVTIAAEECTTANAAAA